MIVFVKDIMESFSALILILGYEAEVVAEKGTKVRHELPEKQ